MSLPPGEPYRAVDSEAAATEKNAENKPAAMAPEAKAAK